MQGTGASIGAASYLGEFIQRQRGHLFGWVPVCLAIGIGGYFSLPNEPSLALLAGVTVGALFFAALTRILPETVSPFAICVALVLSGCVLAGVRAHQVAGPVMGWRYYGPVEGRVVAIDRSQSDAVRLTLDRVVLNRVAPAKTPHRVRLSLHGDAADGIRPEPGLRVMTTAHLSPPSGPVEPGGFDFQRHAWFAQLGSVGYTRVPVLALEPASMGRAGLAVYRIRMAISAHIQTFLQGDTGAVAAALTTGDRSGISQSTLDALRASNLAHLLAISGLHMGLVSAVVFSALRIVLALVPGIALRWPARGIAAAGALIVAAGYLALSGGNVATERAFVMVAVALVALMLNRRAISLRAVALAASLLLIFRPEALLSPGFQMSFAATTALVAVFGWVRDSQIGMGPKWMRPAVTLIISSAVAGAATAPIGAAHFNAVSQFGLIANLLSVPLMGALVVPAALLSGLLSLVGLEGIGLWVMGLGLSWILGVAETVAGWNGARIFVAGPGPWVLPMLALGFLGMILIRGRLRLLGLPVFAASFWVWAVSERPEVLIADSGALVGIMTSEGRALSRPRGAGFAAKNWLENDGDSSFQDQAAAKWPMAAVAGRGLPQFVHLSGKKAIAGFGGCTANQIIVVNGKLPQGKRQECLVFDQTSLRKTGSVAFYRSQGALHQRTAKSVAGARLWNTKPARY